MLSTPPTSNLRKSQQVSGKLSYVIITVDLGSTHCDALRLAQQALLSAVAGPPHRTIVVELMATRCGAAFLSILVGAVKKARACQSTLRISGAAPDVREVLSLCGYGHLLL